MLAVLPASLSLQQWQSPIVVLVLPSSWSAYVAVLLLAPVVVPRQKFLGDLYLCCWRCFERCFYELLGL